MHLIWRGASQSAEVTTMSPQCLLPDGWASYHKHANEFKSAHRHHASSTSNPLFPPAPRQPTAQVLSWHQCMQMSSLWGILCILIWLKELKVAVSSHLAKPFSSARVFPHQTLSPPLMQWCISHGFNACHNCVFLMRNGWPMSHGIAVASQSYLHNARLLSFF